MVEVRNNNFESEVKQGLVVVDFYANWCGPCKMISPVLEELDAEFNGNVKFVKVDVDANTQTARQYQVMSIPNLMLFKDGKVVDHMMGFRPKHALKQWIMTNL